MGIKMRGRYQIQKLCSIPHFTNANVRLNKTIKTVLYVAPLVPVFGTGDTCFYLITESNYSSSHWANNVFKAFS